MLQRYFIEISYKGTDYFGWQRQPRQISLQEVVENALSKIYSNQAISIVGCGRTDTGVHAKQYFFHVDLEPLDSIDQFVFKLNRMLPDSIVVHNAALVDDEKHARFDAKRRTYRYFMHQKKDAFITETSWYFPQKMDIAKMNEAAQLLIGTFLSVVNYYYSKRRGLHSINGLILGFFIFTTICYLFLKNFL
jgi:tRNA pseudouridine38-40 synthase